MKEKKIYQKGLERSESASVFGSGAGKEFQKHPGRYEDRPGGPSRRDFLRMMGFGMGAVSLAACEAPIRKAIPYVNKPVDVDPGIANYYASSCVTGNDFCSIVVKTREGRPIKIEGNEFSKYGVLNSRVEASILSLYDEQRLRDPKIGGEVATWDEIDDRIKAELSTNTKKTVVVSYSNCSPSTGRAIDAMNQRYGNVAWIQYDPLSASGLLDAYQETSGKRAMPVHDFAKAGTIVSFGSDFLGAWPHSGASSREFAATRKLDGDKKDMSRLYVFESNLSLTGSNADYRQQLKPSQQGFYVANLYNLLAQKAGAETLNIARVKDMTMLEKAANDLWQFRDRAIVVCGINDKTVQSLIIAINHLLGSFGNTIASNAYYNMRKGDDPAFRSFVEEARSGRIGAIIFYNCNPVYDHPLGSELLSAMRGVRTLIATNDRADETAAEVKYLTPDHHFLESWNDFEPVAGHLTLAQPVISKIFNTRQAQRSFLAWSDISGSYYDFIRTGWRHLTTGPFDAFWDKCLHDGVYNMPPDPSENLSFSFEIHSLAEDVKRKYKTSSSEIELALCANYSVGDGVLANNPWLQEMPDPVTKACWDNYLTVSPQFAKENGLEYDAERMNACLVDLTVGSKTLQVPVLPQPGQADGTVGLALGYGRTKAGKVANGVGVNAYPLLTTDSSGSISYHRTKNVSLSVVEGKYPIARTQTSETFAGRETIIQETVLEEYRKDPQSGRYFPEITAADGSKEKPYAVSLWKGHEYPNHHWGMIVDLNSCTGCGVCTIACQTENNIPVVGKEEVLNRREMHWIRIDRYYSSSEADVEQAAGSPEVTFQPMMCQQCNAAPCETVCPVAATTHSTEGLNQMTYNRCIGTRYCANNCPYKVRRFNWFKYHDNEKFDKNATMNNYLGKMVLNPDVTVRARGVMEKCTFCVQRIQAGKLTARRESRRPVDGEITTSCVRSCPAGALVFGDMKDPDSRIYKMLKIKEKKKAVEAREPRAYHVLEELRVMPNVWYLTKVRNKDNDKNRSKV